MTAFSSACTKLFAEHTHDLESILDLSKRRRREADLQRLLAEQIGETLGRGLLSLVRREYPTAIGP